MYMYIYIYIYIYVYICMYIYVDSTYMQFNNTKCTAAANFTSAPCVCVCDPFLPGAKGGLCAEVNQSSFFS